MKPTQSPTAVPVLTPAEKVAALRLAREAARHRLRQHTPAEREYVEALLAEAERDALTGSIELVRDNLGYWIGRDRLRPTMGLRLAVEAIENGTAALPANVDRPVVCAQQAIERVASRNERRHPALAAGLRLLIINEEGVHTGRAREHIRVTRA
jgi:hypothetical protein